MDQEDMPCWVDSFTGFCGRFADLFARSETREQARKYLRGLLAPLERKTSWQPSWRLHDSTPDRMQRLLYRVSWDAEEARDRLQQFIIERKGSQEAIGVLDETGIPKKGTCIGYLGHPFRKWACFARLSELSCHSCTGS